MKRTLTLLALLMLVPAAVAQNDTVDETVEDATETVDELIDDGPSPLDQVGDLIEDAGQGIQDAAGGVGDLLGKAVTALGHAIASTATGLTRFGAAASLGLGAAAIWLGEGAGRALIAVGAAGGFLFALAGRTVATVAVSAGDAFAFLGGAYASLVGTLRPDAMSPALFGSAVAAGGAGSAGVGGWAGWNVLKRWGWVASGLGGVGGLGGFSRIQDDQLLEHPVRNQIFGLIQSNPGIHASHLAREVGVGWGTVSHHLDKLSKGHMVTTRKVNNQKCYFEQGGTISRQDMEVASAVKGDTAGRISRFIHRHPMTSQKQMAEALDISPALASFHTKKLVNLGVLDKMRHGKETLLTTSQAMRRLLESDRSLAAAMAAREEDAMDYSA